MQADASTALCSLLHEKVESLQVFTFPFDSDLLPQSGIYVLFEKGEYGHGTNRIVRIGTHTGPRSRLGDRLREHFLNENKDRSIFRKNIGRAILNRDGDPFLAGWNRDLTGREERLMYSSSVDKERLAGVERAVTQYIQANLSFIVLSCPKEMRRQTEADLIGTVSGCSVCRPSEGWLGLHSPLKAIRESGLWQVQGVGRPCSPNWSALAIAELCRVGEPS